MSLRRKLSDAAQRVVLGETKDTTKSVSDALKKAAGDEQKGSGK